MSVTGKAWGLFVATLELIETLAVYVDGVSPLIVALSVSVAGADESLSVAVNQPTLPDRYVTGPVRRPVKAS